MTQELSAQDPAIWEQRLTREGLAPIEPNDTLGMPPVLQDTIHFVEETLGTERTLESVADATIVELRARGIGVRALGFPRCDELRDFLATPYELTAEIQAIDDPVMDTPDPEIEKTFDEAHTSLSPQEQSMLLRGLNEQQKEILKVRFGLGGGTPRSFEEVGQMFNLTRSEVRDIETQAMEQLRHPTSRLPILEA